MIVEAAKDGLLADSALIAHGRGEAFDYLLGEQTCKQAGIAIKYALTMLRRARRPVISVNGNTVALAGREVIILASMIEAVVEVNLFYRTAERIEGLVQRLEDIKIELMQEKRVPTPLEGDLNEQEWCESVENIPILGREASETIPGLVGERSKVCANGILEADVVLVPLEDGDRCEALVAMGKTVINVDLNPLSRSARRASITIVDEVRRCLIRMISIIDQDSNIENWDNLSNLSGCLSVMTRSLELMEKEGGA